MAAKKKRAYRQVRHAYWFQVTNGSGSKTMVRKWAKVRFATKPVVLTLTADHVRKSIKLHGAGSTTKCSMAICTLDHADAFPHPVTGHLDFQYARCFPVSKLDKMALPDECYVYEHDSPIARNQDLPGGQKALLAKILQDGPMTITLRPYRQRSELGRPGRNRSGSGVRDPLKRKGAHLRYAVATLGGTPK